MSKNAAPFDPNEFAKWLVAGLKETIAYRIKQTFNREHLIELIQSKIPTRNQIIHQALKHAFIKNGFHFETLKQGDANFHLIRKKYREVPAGQSVRRLVLIPGFGDTPGSWLLPFTFARRELMKQFDELLILDFPGYMGFLSNQTMVPSMTVLLNVVKMVCEANPPTVLMGHSLGGWLVAKTAQVLTKPFEHLIVIAPSGLTPENERQAFADFILSNQNIEVDALIDKVVYEPKKYHYLLQEEFQHFYSKPEIKEFIESVKEDQFVDSSKNFSCKKLTVIWGEEDNFVPSNWIRHWIEGFGVYTDAYMLKKTGHLPQLECPKVFSDVVMKAIRGIGEIENPHWIKIHSRVKEYDAEENRVRDPRGQKLIS
jgi:pimeloyl-ACP methyl ester carboxylesterase